MALDDLLAKLERNPALHDSGVTRVTGVTPSNGKGFAVTPTDDEGVTTKAAPILECTPVTPVTPQMDNGQGATAGAWMMHFSARGLIEARTSPPAAHAEVLALYPDAIAAEPIPDRTSTRATSTSERNELLALLEAIYADDTEADRQEAIGLALADPDGALTCYRAIAAERGLSVSKPVSTETAPAHLCRTCRHRTTPGRADPGYCDQRDDLPKAYGDGHPLHRLPADGGHDCPQWATYFEE